MKRKKNKLLIVLLVVATLIGLMVFYTIEGSLKPLVNSFAEARVRSITTKAMNDSIMESLEYIDYSDLVKLQYDSEGRIAMLQGNAAQMNRIASSTALAAQQRISELGEQGLSIPIGTIIGGALFAGRGPRVQITITPVGSVVSSFMSDFESAGINQTLHRIKLHMEATVRIVVAGSSSQSVSIVAEMPVTESLIVGDVPQSFVQVPDVGSMLNLVP